MNITNDSAGCVSFKFIQSQGFVEFDTLEINDMGQAHYSMPQFQNDKVKILGGYWRYEVVDIKTNKTLWEGWWNSDEEFLLTMKKLNAL